MATTPQEQLSDLLHQVAQVLDIPEEMYLDAVSKYQQVALWLEENDAQTGRYAPLVYPQGSFLLGTIIRPLSEADEYDIDLVYQRAIQRDSTTKEQLKEEAGQNLRDYVRHCKEAHVEAPRLTEGRRCWTLEYGSRFHMDVLPAIPDDEARLEVAEFSDTAILITDKELRRWQHSNPKGYYEWFKSRMAIQFREKLALLAMEAKSAADEVPEHKVKTPLQRAIQILKRHRDCHFQDDDDRPISIIITTLSARAYNNQSDLVDTVLAMVRGMPRHIEYRLVNDKRVAWVPNPVNENENFADKWEEHPQRETKFLKWLELVERDVTSALTGGGIHKIVDLLGGSLGREVIIKAANALGHQLRADRVAGTLKMASTTGMLGTSGDVTVKEHTFYGQTKERN